MYGKLIQRDYTLHRIDANLYFRPAGREEVRELMLKKAALVVGISMGASEFWYRQVK
jgi:hypothetical protein